MLECDKGREERNTETETGVEIGDILKLACGIKLLKMLEVRFSKRKVTANAIRFCCIILEGQHKIGDTGHVMLL